MAEKAIPQGLKPLFRRRLVSLNLRPRRQDHPEVKRDTSERTQLEQLVATVAAGQGVPADLEDVEKHLDGVAHHVHFCCRAVAPADGDFDGT